MYCVRICYRFDMWITYWEGGRMKKILILEIEDVCHGCPYCDYDDYYSRSSDSGYNCYHPAKSTHIRIASDSQIKKYNNEMLKIRESKNTLFPVEEILVNPMTIPNWCPLPTKE
jgi:hypothetical protein